MTTTTQTTITCYTVRRYRDGVAIGDAKFTSEQYARYEADCQQPEGIIRLGDLTGPVDLDEEYGDVSDNTTVYLD